MRQITTMFILAVACCVYSAEAADWGTFKGQFVLKGSVPKAAAIDPNKDQATCGKCKLQDETLVVDEKTKGIKNIVIYVRTKDVPVHPDYQKSANEKVKFDNDCCRFEPRILCMRLSQTLVLGNSDPVAHNSNLQPLGDVGVNPLIPAGGEVEHKFNREQRLPVPVSCNIHPWMKGFILPRSNPYAVVSGKDGSFELKNLPAGTELEFQVWQEKAGYLVAKPDWTRGRFTLTLKAGETKDLGKVEVPASVFNK